MTTLTLSDWSAHNEIVRRKRRTKSEQLQELLGDFRWHTHEEMVKAGGTRFGARLFDLHRDERHPLHYCKQSAEIDIFLYRQCEQDECDECQHPRESLKAKCVALEAEVSRLLARVEELEG